MLKALDSLQNPQATAEPAKHSIHRSSSPFHERTYLVLVDSPNSNGHGESIAMASYQHNKNLGIRVPITTSAPHGMLGQHMHGPEYFKHGAVGDFDQLCVDTASAIRNRPDTYSIPVVIMAMPLFQTETKIGLANFGTSLPQRLEKEETPANLVMVLVASDPRIHYLAEKAKVRPDQMIKTIAEMYLRAGFDAVLVEKLNHTEIKYNKHAADASKDPIHQKSFETLTVNETLATKTSMITDELFRVLEVANMLKAEKLHEGRKMPTSHNNVAVIFNTMTDSTDSGSAAEDKAA